MYLSFRRAGLPLLAVLLLAWQGRPPRGGGANKYDACRLLTVGDVTVLLGEGTASTLTQGGQNCTWRSDGKMKLMVRTPESTRTKPEVSFEQYKTGPHRDYTIADEKELGDHAVSAITPFGVEFMVLKKDRILYVQYFGPYGMKGTPEMLARARPVMKKAVDAF
jgi:hypothetical protein